MDALAGKGVEDDRERRGERLALAGAHLGDRPAVENHAADQLDVEMAHAHLALADLADDREALVLELVERLSGVPAFAERVHPRAKLLVGLELELGFVGANQLDPLLERLELLALAPVEGAIKETHTAQPTSGRDPSAE